MTHWPVSKTSFFDPREHEAIFLEKNSISKISKFTVLSLARNWKLVQLGSKSLNLSLKSIVSRKAGKLLFSCHELQSMIESYKKCFKLFDVQLIIKNVNH